MPTSKLTKQYLNQPDSLPRWVDVAVFLIIAAAILLPRLDSLGSFVTADEPTWGKRSANFYYALRDGKFVDTYQTGHPGVITMWAGALGYHLQFPDYERVGQENLGDTRLFDIFKNRAVNPMKILATARLAVVLVVTLSLLAAWYYARQLFGPWIALAGILLIAFEPMHVAHSRFLHTNGLSSSFLLVSVLAFLDFLRRRHGSSLLVSATAAGLGFLTVTPSFMIIPIIGFLGIQELFGKKLRAIVSLATVRRVFIPLLAWGLLSLLVVFIVWPAMWVDPLGTLGSVFEHAFNAAEGGGGGAELVSAYQVDYDPSDKYVYYYPLTYLWRSTPVTWIGLLALGFILATRNSGFITAPTRRSLAGLAWFIVLFTILMTLGTKKFDRYYLPCYLAFDFLAAAGLVEGLRWLGGKFTSRLRTIVPVTAMVFLLAIQALLTASHHPYYLTYFNPLLGGIQKATDVLLVGWGEGLNEAAIYMKTIPGMRTKRIVSWYPLAFNWYSHSLGFISEPIDIARHSPPEVIQSYLDADYVLVYLNQWQRNMPSELFAALEQIEPEHIVQVKGVDYVKIYNLESMHQQLNNSP